MAQEITVNLELTLPDPDQQDKTVVLNEAIQNLEEAETDTFAVAMTDADKALTDAEYLRNYFFDVTGTLTAGRNLTVPANKRKFAVRNGTTGGFAITVKTTVGSGVALAAGSTQQFQNIGTDVIALAAAV